MKKMSEKEYFNYLKSNLQKITDEDMINFYEGCLSIVNKYRITGQLRILEKLKFLTDCAEKEREIIKLGINSFVYLDVIEDYIDNISKNTVKIIELENYPRDIPDEIVQKIALTKDIFDKMYVVFTDYTGAVEKQVSKERREKDPMLFGTFQKQRTDNVRDGNVINERFYFIGDWEDEYCDLTMDKFLKEVGKEKLQIINTPLDFDTIKKELDRLDDDNRRLNNKELKQKKKPSFIHRIFKK